MLQRNGEDIASKSVFNEANLKEHLRGKTADELIEELEKLYDEEELTGEEFDPRIVEIYIEAMEKEAPQILPRNVRLIDLGRCSTRSIVSKKNLPVLIEL